MTCRLHYDEEVIRAAEKLANLLVAGGVLVEWLRL